MTQIVFLHVGQDYIYPTLLVRSIRSHHPRARITQCSDLHTPQVEGTDAVQRLDEDVANLMTFRLSCFSQLKIEAPTIFLDTDMLCLKCLDLPGILRDNDIAVCHRQFEIKQFVNINFKRMNLCEYTGKTFGQAWPYLACATITKSTDFWVDCLQNLLQLHPKFHLWLGDQEAIRNVVASNKYKTGLLPESIYACLPEVRSLYGQQVKLLHFKNAKRKEIMVDQAKKMGFVNKAWMAGISSP